MRKNRSVPPCPVIPVLIYPDPSVAAEWLSKAFQDRCFELISLRVDPRWQSLKGDPEFHQLFGRLGLP